MKVNLGSGVNVIEGWVNIDIIDHPDVLKQDLRQPLQFKDGSISFFYTEHFIEHLDYEDAKKLMCEMFRCLGDDGVIRISVPNLDTAIQCYIDNDYEFWNDIGWFPTDKCDMINGSMRNWGHKFSYNADKLISVLKSIGFSEVKQVEYRVSEYPTLSNMERRVFKKDLIIEAKK